MNAIKQFEEERKNRIELNGKNKSLKDAANHWLKESMMNNYVYNFTWLGRPIIQSPQDIVALQELVWEIKPDMIIETGIAHGGSLILSASLLTLLEVCGEINEGKVLGIDIDIRDHNRKEILNHPLSKKITMLEGSSLDNRIVSDVYNFAKNGKKILICLDSNHTHEHVLAELNTYANLCSIGSYCIVFDTLVEDMPAEFSLNRPWGIGNNPRTAVKEFLKNRKDFMVDEQIENKLLTTSASGGYLKRIK